MSRAIKVELAEEVSGDTQSGGSGPPVSLQQLWFTLQREEWSSLVVMPAGPETSALDVARTLHELGKLTMGERLRLLDARGVPLSGTAPFILEMTGSSPVRPAQDARSERVLVVVDWVMAEPSGIPIALAADAVLLCVQLGKTTFASARHVIELIGAQRFMGCITVG
jgi:hypothetical protein